MTTREISLFYPVRNRGMEQAAIDVIKTGQVASGQAVAKFEAAFSKCIDREFVVSTSDLTSALTLALYLAGVRPGDKVATVAFSCLQSNSAISRIGANPVWIDINPESMSMSVADLKAKLQPSIKAVMLYHIAGYQSETQKILELCKSFQIPLIEDCNNAIGATLDGKPSGFYGDYAAYSFYPNRQINGVDGGALAVPTDCLAKLASRMRRFGIDQDSFRDARGEINPASDVPEIGWSAAFTNLNASIALSQLDTLNHRITATKENAGKLYQSFSDLKNIKPVVQVPSSSSAFWGFLVLSEHRDQLLAYLKSHAIKTSILHQRNDAYSGFGTGEICLPGTKKAMEQMLALPCGWWLTEDDLKAIINAVRTFDSSVVSSTV